VKRDRSEQGYVLLGIAIGLVIMGIFMAAAVPAWEYVIQREKEEELLWRGRQYVKALERYQRKYPGAFPASVDALVEEKFLRKAYEDPMSGEGEWRILRQNSPELQGPVPGGPQGPQAMPGRDPRIRAPQPFRSPQPIGRPSQLGRQSLQSMTDQQLGGIVGVASASDKSTIRIPGRKEAAFLRTVGEGEKYNEWLFVFQVAQDPTQPGLGQPGRPGQGPGGQPPVRPGFPGGGPGGPGGFNTPNTPNRPRSPNPPGAPQR